MADRLTQSEAIELVSMILACWPAANDTKAYIGSLAAILQDYPRVVAVQCADPRRGVARELKFRPAVGDLARFCEREATRLHLRGEREALAQQLALERQAADRKARGARPTIDELRAKHGPNWGLKSMDDTSPLARRAGRDQAATEIKIRAEYSRLGRHDMTKRDTITALQDGRWPRLLNRAVAAEYCGVGIDTFNTNVDRGALPQPLQLPTGAVLWDRAELDGAIDLLKTGRRPAEESIGNVREDYEAFKRERLRGAAKRRS